MDNLSPKQFMKGRRPQMFSDTTIVKRAALNRSMLEQHLESLTTRNQENEFAEFARKLCQFEIMPNLRPQTGPVGGGDSKTDSETIPVSSQTRMAYYQGEDNQSKDLFAFAFSAKKAWTGKARDDARKIHGLRKCYKRIYFVTNQSARDKTRAEIETELSSECGIEIVILDKNWILDRVFTNKREKLAIEELEMGDGLQEVVEVGPLDLQRERKLSELNSSIAEAVSKNLVTSRVVTDTLDAALIAKELDKPRTDVEGQFERAIRFARQYGNMEHLFTALYQRAWATFFWFEDFKTFVGLYNEIESLAIQSRKIFSVERLSNLWSLLRVLSGTPTLVSEDLLKTKAQTLRDLLEETIGNEANQSASLQAEALLCMLSLADTQNDDVELGTQFTKFKNVLDRANVLIGFPFESTVNVLVELDDVFSGLKEYEELQEHLVDITGKRRGEIPAGTLLLQRGIQHLKANRFYEAIDCIGRSLHRFYKQESKDHLVRALAILARAYESVGLLWAARGALLNAASHATSDFWKYNEINTAQIRCCDGIKRLEIQLGRVGSTLDWHRTHTSLSMELATTEIEREGVLERSLQFGAILGLLLIKTREEDLKAVEKLPDTLLSMDLDFAGFGLAYRLGGKEALPESFHSTLGGDDPDTFFSHWPDQPALADLPDYPDYYLDDNVQLHSRILGCEFIVKTTKNSPEIEVAEYLAAALESFLSTSIQLDALSIDSVAVVRVVKDASLGTDLRHTIDTDGKLTINVICGDFNPHSLSNEEQRLISSKISDIVLDLIGQAIMFADPESDLEKLFRDEEVHSRAFNFSSPMVTLGNVLGYSNRRSISEWISEKNTRYPHVPGKFSLTIPPKSVEAQDSAPEADKKHRLTHAEIKNHSVIRPHLWDKAGWLGTFYQTAPNERPVLALVFKDKKSAKAVFDDWKETFGNEDKEDTIRVAVARGIDAQHPAWYRVAVGTNFTSAPPASRRIMTVTRLHTMNPESTANLDRFMEDFRKWGCYLFAPAIMSEGQSVPELLIDSGIEKRELTERTAWEIGPNDIDITLITPDTNPLVPTGVTNPPVIETLNKIRLMRTKK